MKINFGIGIACMALAGSTSAPDMERPGSSTDLEPLYTMSLLNTWQLNWISPGYNYYCDLDYHEATETIRTVSSTTDSLYWFSVSDPTVLTGSMYLNLPKPIQTVATDPVGTELYIWVTEGTYEGRYFRYYNGTWSWYTGNPPHEYGMGIEMDEYGFLWESGYGGAVFRFYPASSVYELYYLQITGVYPLGLTLFPYPGGTGIAIGYDTNKIVEFYLYSPPSSWTFLGSASVPGNFDSCRGLEYISDRNSFYMLVKTSWSYQILELSCDILDLQSDTWGSIKSAF
jgi:hypothetical protein